jgi:hypothetical protein
MDEATKHGLLFSQLIIMFHAVGLQQMGKAEHPVTKVVEKDVLGAGSTIDLIAMLRAKTRGNLSTEEEALVEQVLTELTQLYEQETPP